MARRNHAVGNAVRTGEIAVFRKNQRQIFNVFTACGRFAIFF